MNRRERRRYAAALRTPAAGGAKLGEVGQC